MAEADGEGVGEEDGGDDGRARPVVAPNEFGRRLGGVDTEMPIWRKRPFPADTLAPIVSRSWTSMMGARSRRNFLNSVGSNNAEITPPSNSNHSRYGAGQAVEKLKLEYA